jgi:DNA-binding transcriptional ArsR family regulator
LLDGRLLSVERQGRHRYYRLANAEVADAIEALMLLTVPCCKSRTVATESMAYARTCYSHLAGRIGVQIADALHARELLAPAEGKTYKVTPAGEDWFDALGIETAPARQCLDWTERRHHLAGALGCAMYRRFRELRWMAKIRDTREVRITVEGKRRLWELLRVNS